MTLRVLVLLLTLVFSCAGPRPAPHEPLPEKKAGPVLNVSDLEKEIHLLINRERVNKGLSPLSWNSTLSRIARRHSQDMVVRKYFSHFSPEGNDFSYRYREAGFSCSIREGNAIYEGAENIFQNNLYDRILVMNGVKRYEWNTAKHIAETTVRGWMNSRGHRKNILMPYWQREGIGISLSPDDKIYITQNFC